MNKYKQRVDDIKNGKVKPFEDFEASTVKKFKHWLIVKNEFPYDAVSEVNHMLFTIRKIPFSWDYVNKDEMDELNELKKTYLNKEYDVIYENLPKGQTVPGHFHIHLLKLKREEF